MGRVLLHQEVDGFRYMGVKEGVRGLELENGAGMYIYNACAG